MEGVYDRTPKEEIEHRTVRLRNALADKDLHGALLFSPQEMYYYSGVGIEGTVFVPIEGEVVHLVKRNIELAHEYSQIEKVKEYGRLSKLFETLDIDREAKLAVEGDILPYSFVRYLQSKARDIELVDSGDMLRGVRAIKSEYEIRQIEIAADIVDASFEYCCKIARPDMTEVELSNRLDSWMIQQGHDGVITTRAFGSSMVNYSYVISSRSATLNSFFTPVSAKGLSLKYPFGSSHAKLGRGSPFIVDTCGNAKGYISDTTRTFVIGNLDQETSTLLDALTEIIDWIGGRLRPGKNLGDLYRQTYSLADEMGVQDCFMGSENDRVAFIGHGVGLELDELPIMHSKGGELRSGHVIACEPKIIFPGEKVLGIENTYAITEKGSRQLSKAPYILEI